ncbi:dynein light chain 1, axonemal-like [Orussus abietinus]|uniref:dynein light chain 1, axonemal-like n=1 Tax=Orussus abietinus TaxID=222816 RepID=UPI000C716160|nr:dynein light chain 1, axonemal-like [Orussus abietinus]
MAAGKPTACKEAIRRWEEETGGDAATATEVDLSFQWPPLEKMDNALATLAGCERLSLSTNRIEKIAGVAALGRLKVLSLGRNSIKSLAGLEPLGDTLEELWISYNCLEKLKGIQAMQKLRVFYASNNQLREWAEVVRLQDLPRLRDLVLAGNPICEGVEVEAWRAEVARRLPLLDKLDGDPVLRDEDGPLVRESRPE